MDIAQHLLIVFSLHVTESSLACVAYITVSGCLASVYRVLFLIYFVVVCITLKYITKFSTKFFTTAISRGPQSWRVMTWIYMFVMV